MSDNNYGKSASELVKGMLGDAAAGKSSTLESLTGGDGNPATNSYAVSDEDIYRAENSTVEDTIPGGEDTPQDSGEQSDSTDSSVEAKSEEAPAKTSSKEIVTITDEKGKRRVEVDFSDKEQVKKYVQMAHGARKWQAERDRALSEKKELETKHSEMGKNWDVLNRVFQEQGAEGLVDLLAGKKGAFEDVVKQKIQRAEFMRTASPEEIEALQFKEKALKQEQELAKMRQENEEFKKSISEKEEKAELNALESRINPAFDKYRFADKLNGDLETEAILDEMLWGSTMKRLEAYEEKGIPISQELANKEFAAVSSNLRKRINMQAEKKAEQVVTQKKVEATEHAQTAAKKGYAQSGARKEAADLINKGDLTSVLKNWGKFGSVFNKQLGHELLY